MTKEFAIGTRVRTKRIDNPSDDWTMSARSDREFGITGTVIKESNSHGLCYGVRHDDTRVVGYYEPRELDILEHKICVSPDELERFCKGGALPPAGLEWQIGKTAIAILFVRNAENYITHLKGIIEKVKSGEITLESDPELFKALPESEW